MEVPGGDGAAAHRAVATPITFGGIDGQAGPVPGLGEHTAEVLAELAVPPARPAQHGVEP